MTGMASLAGCYHVELTSADVAHFVDLAARLGLSLLDVSWKNDLTIQFYISRKHYRKLDSLSQRQGVQLKILSRRGAYWSFRRLFDRPLFLSGMVLLLFLGILLPCRILFVEVQGNSRIETARILETASDFGVRFGASRRFVRSEQVKNQLIGAIPELGWVGVNTKGCVAVISVREKATQEPTDFEPEPGSIVASRDGIILDCSAAKGKLLCAIGQAVSQGDVLISGSRDLLGVDAISGASGEIFAATGYHFSVLTPDFSWVRGENCQQKVSFSLQIGKNLINFFKGSGISGGSCVKMYSKYVLTLPGGFTLPVALIKWYITSTDSVTQDLSEDEAKMLLSDFASAYLEEQMIAGRIVRKDEILMQTEGAYQLTGKYACTEMIGRAQKEQIGAYHGKTD